MLPSSLRSFLLALIILTGSASHAAGPTGPASFVAIPVGMSLMLRVRDDGKAGFIVDSMTQTSPTIDSDFERHAANLARAQSGSVETFTGVEKEAFPANTMPPKPRKNKVRLTLKRLDGNLATLLFVENGYKRGVYFRAELTNDRFPLAKGHPTSICPIPPGITSFEYWPYNFLYLKVSGFIFEDINPETPINCR